MFNNKNFIKKSVSSSSPITIGEYREQAFLKENFYSRYIPPKVGTLELTNFILLFTFIFLLSTSFAQNNDCNNLLELKDTVYIAKNISGFGQKQEFKGNDINDKYGFEQEENSIWYLIKMPAAGKFTFDIIAQNATDDWDFLLYEHKNLFCKRIDSNKIEPIRSNLSRSAITGLSLTATQKYSGAGLNDNYSQYLEVKEGEEYVLVVNNPKNPNRTHKLVLHLPKNTQLPVKEELVVEPIVDSNLKKFILEIKDKSSKKALPANVSIVGLRKENIEFKDLTIYETKVTKQNYDVNVIAYAEGFMLSSFDFKLSKTRSSDREIIYLEPIEEGKKVNLKNIQFYGERADFLPTAEGSLSSLLKFLEQNSTVKVEIEGHVNGPSKPNTSAFKKLSFDRALAVKQYLVENGIESERIQYVGYGNSQMLYPYPMKEDEHSANRRVEVKIISK